MPEANTPPPPWFSISGTKSSIDLLARTKLTLALGAGVGIDAGLPAWKTLVYRVLAAQARKRDEEVRGEAEQATGRARVNPDDFAKALIASHGLLIAGTIAQLEAESDAEFVETLKAALYQRRPGKPTVGVLARRAAALIAQSGSDTAVTTSYDDTVDLALRAFCDEESIATGTRRAVRSVSGPAARESSNEIIIQHVHGYLPKQGPTDQETVGRIVFGDLDFALTDDRDKWRRDCYRTAIEKTALFVGTSLGDPNVVRYLNEIESTGKQHYVLAVRGDGPFALSDAPAHVVERVEAVLTKRLRQLNLKPILPDYYSQVSQFLNEIAIWRTALSQGKLPLGQDTYASWDERYGKRLEKWNQRFKPRALPSSPHLFKRVQTALNDHLLSELDAILTRLSPSATETFGLSIWAREPFPPPPKHRSLIEWCSSICVFSNRAGLREAPVHEGSSWRASEAFCSGGQCVWGEEQAGPSSRWRTVLASPIYLESLEWKGLPVGVIMLTSSLPLDSSAIRADQRSRASIWQTLNTVGARLLDPQGLVEILQSSGLSDLPSHDPSSG